MEDYNFRASGAPGRCRQKVRGRLPGSLVAGSRPRLFFTPPGARGLALIEICVASFLLLLGSLTLTAALLFADKAAAYSGLQLNAAHILQGEIERIRAMPYEAVVPGAFKDADHNTSPGVYLDKEERVRATVQYDILQTVKVQSGSGRSVVVDTTSLPKNAIRNQLLIPNELKGNIMLVASGRGATQRAYITGNTATEIQFTGDESGKTQKDLYLPPDSTSVIQFNMGTIATVRLGWSLLGRTFSEEMRTLVILPLEL